MKIKTPPNLKTAGFSLWIHSREFPEKTAFWDVNWLVVSAQLDTGNGRSWVEKSASLTTFEIRGFIEAFQHQNWQNPEAKAELKALKREIHWVFFKDKRYPENVICKFQVDANFVHEQHIGYFVISMSEAQEFVRQLSVILENYPVLGEEDKGDEKK